MWSARSGRFRPARHRPEGYVLNNLGIDYNYVSNEFDAWATAFVMDVWHWTSLVALLATPELKSIPDAYYQRRKFDGASRWAVFRAIQLPKMNRVLLIAVLLRFMTPHDLHRTLVVTGGGPGNSTTFVFHRTGQDRARAIRPRQGRRRVDRLQSHHHHRVLDFYTVMTNVGVETAGKGAA